jgi:hypothetical protein
MKFYYTILKISPNTSSGDSISIGLLAFNEKEAVISFSETRKLLAKKMVQPDLVDFFCKQLTSKVNELNKTHQSQLGSLFKNDYVFDASYIDYLSNYSNGLLQLSKSNLFLKTLDETSFNLLFETMVDKIEIKPSQRRKPTNFNKIVDEKLISKVKNKVHTNIKIDSSLIPNLYFSYDMDCIGKNGVFVGAKVVDFTNKKQALDHTISHYNSLIAILSGNNKKDILKNNFYLISEEPKQINTAEYEIWDSIQNNPLFNVIHPDESNIVVEKIESSKAVKFLGQV